MLTHVDDEDRIRREHEEWSGPLRPQVEVATALIMLISLLAVVSLIGWLASR